MDRFYIDCCCASPEHVLRFTWDDEAHELYTEVQLIQWRNPFKRLLVAIQYLFGHQSNFGVWDCCIMDMRATEKLHKHLGDILAAEKAGGMLP